MWKAPSVGVGIVVVSGEETLLIRRRNAHGRGTWSTPGGYLDWGEAPDACALRELREETNVSAESASFLALTNDVFPETDRHFITIWMVAHVPANRRAITPSEEVAEAGWFRFDRLPEPRFVCFENLVTGGSYPPEAWEALSRPFQETAR